MLCVLWLCVLPYELMRVGVWGFQWIVCCVLMCRFCLMWWMMLMVIVSANNILANQIDLLEEKKNELFQFSAT